MLRVLHVTTSDQLRGAEVFAADLVRAVDALRPAAAEQHVAVLRGGGGVDMGAPTTVLAAGGRFGACVAARRLRALVRSWRPDVVQVHGGDALRAVVLARIRTPVVHRRIGAAPPHIRSGWRRAWHARLLRHPALVLPVAEHLRQDDLRLFGLRPDVVRTVPNAVDPARISVERAPEVRAALCASEHDVVIVSLGSLSWEKDPLAALAASAPVLGPGVVHVFVGDGPLAEPLRLEVARSGLSSSVHVLPARPDVGSVLGAGDIFLFSSRSDGMEGMPAVIIEAGMCGLPVVATDVAGVGEVVLDGLTGILVPASDPGALAAAIAALVADPDRRVRLGAAARARCIDRFRLEVVASAYVDAWREVAGEVGDDGVVSATASA